MKKKLLSIALVTASLPSFAGEFHGSFSGMSGAAYATGNYSEGVLLNPSLGASYNPEKDDFALLFSVGALGSDKEDLIDQADELVDLIDEIENSTILTTAQAQDLKSRLENIDDDRAQVSIGASLAVSIPTELVSMAFIVNSRGYVSLAPDVAQSDLTIIDNAIGGVFDPEDDVTGLKSTINAHGAMVTDIGVSFSKAFAMSNGNHLLVGVKPKKVEVESIIYKATVAEFDEDDFDADEFTRTESAINYDLGVTYLTGNMRYGLVVNNLQNQTYETVDANQDVAIERQMTGAVGYVSGKFKAEVAADLNSVPAIGLNGEVQLLRAGLEYSAWDWVRLRAGIEQDSKNTLDDTYSFGIGIGALNLAYITGSDETQGAALSFGLRF